MKSEEHSTAAMSAKSIAPMEKIDILEKLKSGSSALMGESAKRKQENQGTPILRRDIHLTHLTFDD